MEALARRCVDVGIVEHLDRRAGTTRKRHGEAAGFWRRPNDDRTLRNLYPNGFLPMIDSDIWDASGAVGVKGTKAGWNMDLGTVYGGKVVDRRTTVAALLASAAPCLTAFVASS
mgnify:CR=1 FL=1